MHNIRGLKSRLCPECHTLTPHRTLYAKTEFSGKTKWLQLFWACAACDSLNHVILPYYRINLLSSPLPSRLAVAVVNALRDQPLDFEGLVDCLRRKRVEGVAHLFNSNLAMTLEFLNGRGVILKESVDRTSQAVEALKATMGRSVHLGPCPVDNGMRLVSLYSKRQQKLVPAGVLCVSCGYHRVEP